MNESSANAVLDTDEASSDGEGDNIMSVDQEEELNPQAVPNNDTDMEDDNSEVNPLRRLVVKAVLDAMSIMEKSGSSINTFEEILDYGKTMLFTGLCENVDVDILTSIWPKNWLEVQTLLKEEGFSNPTEYYICICREEKETKRNGKVTKKYHYSRKWSIMESKDEVCSHCGKCGYIKYYYLGLSEIVKNWFKSKSMCQKMLSHWKEKEHWLNRDTSWPLKK